MNKIDVGNICVDCGFSTELGSGKFVNRIPKDTDGYQVDQKTKDLFSIKNDDNVEGWQCPDCQQLECDDCRTKTLDYVLHDGMVYCEDCYEDWTGLANMGTRKALRSNKRIDIYNKKRSD